MPYNTEYASLLELFIKLVESQAGREIKPNEVWLNDAQVLATKLFKHLVAMQTLHLGTTVRRDNETDFTFVDHGSIKVVTRAAFETYLVFFYLYGNSDRALSEFRHKTWHLGGLIDRQKFHASSSQARETLIDEKEQIDKLKSEVTNSTQICDYTGKQIKRLLGGEWRIGSGWLDLGISAGFHKEYFKNIYGYLCGYSHSSYLSALQIGQAQSIEDQKMLSEAMLGVGVVVMAHFTFSYSNTFSTANNVLLANPAAKSIAEKWKFGPEDMSKIYGN